MDARAEKAPGVVESSRLIIEEFGGPEGIAKFLHTSTETGIRWSPQERSDREQAFGKNSFPPPRIKTLWELVMDNFKDQINRILLGAAIVSIIIGLIQHGWPKGMLEGTSIMFALCIIICVSSGNNYASERRLANLVALADQQEVAVYRKGKSDETETISYEDLVVGDLVVIQKGMKVPAECMLVSGQNVQCKEDALTGEPDELEKTALTQENYGKSKSCIMFAKATVSNGVGTAIVLTVGENTASGAITKKTQEQGEEEDEGTLLQQKLNRIADQIGRVGYGCAIATFIAIVIRIICEFAGLLPCGCQNLATCEQADMIQEIIDTVPQVNADGTPKMVMDCKQLTFADPNNRLYTELLNTIIIAITVVVVAIPEGLPLAVTISLSFSSAKMQKENNLVRKLASAETMGAVTHICSDKTGTLTQNVMTTMACMVNQRSFRMASEHDPKVAQLAQDVQGGVGDAWESMAQGAIWNSSARIEEAKKPEGDQGGYTGVEGAKWEYQGNVTEIGILKFFAGVMQIEGVRAKKLSLTADKILCVVPFDSGRKRGSIVVRRDDGGVRVYTKGAPDVLFGKDADVVKRMKKEILASNPNMDELEAAARADKQAGYGMVRYAQTARGKEDWYGKATAENIESLQATAQLAGNSAPDHEDVFKACVKDYAMQAYRTILICYRDMSMREYEQLKADNNQFEEEKDRDCIEADLVALGLFGIQDPLRETIVKSVEQVKAAGIKVIMCTGDNIDTATAISKNAGIVTDADIARNPKWSRMVGEDFRATVGTIRKIPDPNDTETDPAKRKMIDAVGNQGVFNRVIKHLRVLARSSPDDKYLLVTGLQACPYEAEEDAEAELEAQIPSSSGPTNYCSVAVTGDGTNDAPALAKANVGFAMGITGTDVAKGACDIILLDDNFASIITALRYGRNIYDNVRKFLQFQLTVNVVAMFIVFFGSVMLNDSPLTAVQMLWVNLIMDTLAALALATEPPDDAILERKPQPSSKPIVTEIMWRNVYGHAIYQMIVLVIIIFVAQGTLVETYDVKCLVPRKNNACPEKGLNPFYASKHYFELDTKDYWTVTMIDRVTAADFAPEAWVRFQCYSVLRKFGVKRFGGKECTAATYEDILRALNDKTTAIEVVAEATPEKTLLKQQAAQDKKNKELGIGQVTKAGLVDANGAPTVVLDYSAFLPQKIPEGSGTQKLLHMTYVFQIFVFMQVFNQMNARILTDSFNIFAGICRNWLFVAVTLFTIVIQVLLVEVGGKVTKTEPLTMSQNGICLIFGAGEMFWGVLIKFLPVKFFQCFNFEEKPMTEEEVEASTLGKFKKGSTVAKPKSKQAIKIEGALGRALLQKVNEQKERLAGQKGH